MRHLGAAHVTLAVPVGSSQAVEWLRPMADEVVCLETPEPFYAVGQHYRDLRPGDDDEVIAILRRNPGRVSARSTVARIDEDVIIAFDGMPAARHLTIPDGARGIVLFAHGSGSSRLSPRNVAVAKVLQGAGLGTLLFDLLSADEADVRANVFDIELLAERLVQADAVAADPRGRRRAAARLLRCVDRRRRRAGRRRAVPDDVLRRRVARRTTRPRRRWLPKVQAPTLLVVGGHDYAVIDLNREAQRHLRCTSLLEIVRGATHLFEEPGTLAQAARLAQSWFLAYLPYARVAGSLRRDSAIAPTVDPCIVLPPRCSCWRRVSPGPC